MKVCRVCKTEKELAQFSVGRGTCKPCRVEQQKVYYRNNRDHYLAYQKWYSAENPEKVRAYKVAYWAKNKEALRDRELRSRYGITSEDYDELVRRQQGRCAICERAMRLLSVDHDHQTGCVRGLLCPSCNSGLGYFGDSSARLRAAIRYVAASLPEHEPALRK